MKQVPPLTLYVVEVYAETVRVQRWAAHAKVFDSLCKAYKWMSNWEPCGVYKYTFKIYTATEVQWSIETKETLVIKE